MTFQPQVVLHISDLHFGSDKSESEKAVRALALEGLVSAILALDEEWRPTIVCISGDIAWKGRAGEYVEAAQWLKGTLDKLSVSPDHVLICAGNHDIDRSKVSFSRPRSPRKADQFLAVPIDSGAPSHSLSTSILRRRLVFKSCGSVPNRRTSSASVCWRESLSAR